MPEQPARTTHALGAMLAAAGVPSLMCDGPVLDVYVAALSAAMAQRLPPIDAVRVACEVVTITWATDAARFAQLEPE